MQGRGHRCGSGDGARLFSARLARAVMNRQHVRRGFLQSGRPGTGRQNNLPQASAFEENARPFPLDVLHSN